ncbi:flavin-binding monooxygenase-like protein [Metarhizium robertsii]|uniref:Flavin-binding monooxygenase-like protein n=1 Tax=Metarhizium robertsii TaxID=568076 RepID=A0A0A1UN68_9HYPO|nr:flavin-binding monooxygenase-like protein [Metarhizium robertsii]
MRFSQFVTVLPPWLGACAGSRCHTEPNVVDVDVAIVGGGAGGIHAAIHLKDAGASVVVIEKKDQIGGHAETYINPDTGVTSNVGVVLFEKTELVKRYFARLGVPTITSTLATGFSSKPLSAELYDFALGTRIPPTDAADATAQQQAVEAAAQAYTQNVLSKYAWIDQGFFVPDPVPEELYLPFSQLADKYGFSALLPIVARLNWYTGNLTTIPALYGLKSLGPGFLSSILEGEYIFSGTGDARSLYDKALEELGSSVLLSTAILSVDRHSNSTGVTLLVAEPDKAPTMIQRAIFSKFFSLGYFAGVARVPGFNGSLINFGAQTPFNQPIIPGNNVFVNAGSPEEVLIGGGFDSGDVTDEQGKDLVRKNLATLAAAGAVPEDAAETVTFPYTSNHTPYNVRVTAEDIRAGFYTKLLALQGSGNTYWTGAAFAGHNSALIWTWNEGTIVPRLKGELGLE